MTDKSLIAPQNQAEKTPEIPLLPAFVRMTVITAGTDPQTGLKGDTDKVFSPLHKHHTIILKLSKYTKNQ